jgi:hypothetical protein
MTHEPNVISVLEPSQLTAATERALPRRKLSWGILILLALLRAYILIAIAIVCFAFVHAIATSR